MQWAATDESVPKKAKTVLSAGNIIMATVFIDEKRIIFIELEKQNR